MFIEFFQGFLSPTPDELERELYEIFPCHMLPLLGHGVIIEEVDEPEEYWDLYESQGKYWGTGGFVRMARHHSLIKEAIEMKVFKYIFIYFFIDY